MVRDWGKRVCTHECQENFSHRDASPQSSAFPSTSQERSPPRHIRYTISFFCIPLIQALSSKSLPCRINTGLVPSIKLRKQWPRHSLLSASWTSFIMFTCRQWSQPCLRLLLVPSTDCLTHISSVHDALTSSLVTPHRGPLPRCSQPLSRLESHFLPTVWTFCVHRWTFRSVGRQEIRIASYFYPSNKVVTFARVVQSRANGNSSQVDPNSLMDINQVKYTLLALWPGADPVPAIFRVNRANLFRTV